MNTQSLQIAARLNEARKLREEHAALKRENAHLRDEIASLEAHLDLAQTVLTDLGAEGRHLVLVDGWNLILGAGSRYRTREALAAHYAELVESDPKLVAWIILDGPKANTSGQGRLRITYTGGTGSQRADRFIQSVVRAAGFLGLGDKVAIHTKDKDLLKRPLAFSGKI